MSAMLDKSLSDDMKGKIDYFTLPEMREGTTNANQINVAGGTPMCFSAEKWDEQTEQLILYYCQYMATISLSTSLPRPRDMRLLRARQSTTSRSLTGLLRTWQM